MQCSGATPAGERHAIGSGTGDHHQRVRAVGLPVAIRRQVGTEAERGKRASGGRHNIDRLGLRECADAVDERTARFHERRRGEQDPLLQLGEFVDIFGPDPPAGIGTT